MPHDEVVRDWKGLCVDIGERWSQGFAVFWLDWVRGISRARVTHDWLDAAFHHGIIFTPCPTTKWSATGKASASISASDGRRDSPFFGSIGFAGFRAHA